ncbi:ankyrin [Anaeromyces robustus]|uniref:Ankyrin n=1 Tax=Anaeromyces robustus TaxID=1754192 RepID=A0A1Y1X9M2_9FUNG|nr:ankyrin [Anaeromyces robustus]|eukprot:ORX82034.1 ankyrin [Anaeromyces robustus]
MTFNIVDFINNNDISGLARYLQGNKIKASFLNNDEKIIKDLIKDGKNNFLNVIFNAIKFNNEFILKLLILYKNKNMTITTLKRLITEEKKKITITDEMYDVAFNNNNYMALKILFENEHFNYDSVALKRIIKYNLIVNSVKTNDYYFIKKVLNYKKLNFKNFKYEEILTEAFKNNMEFNTNSNDNNIVKLLVKSLIKQPYTEYKYINLLLNIAIKVNNMNLVHYLIESEDIKYAFKEINTKDLRGEYPVIVALSNKNIEIFELFLRMGADYNTKNNSGIPLIFLAVYLNDIDFIFTLVNDKTRNKININELDGNGYTPLIYSYIYSYIYGYKDIFNYLLEYSDINKKDKYGHNILYYAVEGNDSKTVKDLITIGAKLDENVINAIIKKSIFKDILDYDFIPVNYISKEGDPLIISLILYGFYKEECIKKLIKKGCNINVQDKDGNTPLMYAVKNEYSDIVQILIKSKAIKTITNLEGKKAIDFLIDCNCYREYSNKQCRHQIIRNLLY